MTDRRPPNRLDSIPGSPLDVTPGAAVPASIPRRVRIAALARLELGEVLRSRWMAFCAGLYATLAAVFFLIGLRSSAVLGFTGMDHVLLSLGHALVLLLPLLALAGSGLVVSRAREGGLLELLFSHPIARDDYLVALTVVRYGALMAPLFVLMPVMALLGHAAFGEPVAWGFLGRTLAVSAALAWTFVGIGLAISTRVKDSARAIVYILLAWALGVALLDFGLIGLMLQWQLPAATVFTIAAANPVETARLALLSGADPSLDTLGPVGYFLAQQAGSPLLFVAGVVWPAAVGTLAWLLARRSLNGGDLV